MRPVSTVNLPQLWPARCHRSFHSAIQMLPVLPRMSNTIFSRRMSKSGAVVARDTLICKTEASGEKSERNPCTLPIICISLRDSIARRILTLSPKGDARREGEMTSVHVPLRRVDGVRILLGSRDVAQSERQQHQRFPITVQAPCILAGDGP